MGHPSNQIHFLLLIFSHIKQLLYSWQNKTEVAGCFYYFSVDLFVFFTLGRGAHTRYVEQPVQFGVRCACRLQVVPLWLDWHWEANTKSWLLKPCKEMWCVQVWISLLVPALKQKKKKSHDTTGHAVSNSSAVSKPPVVTKTFTDVDALSLSGIWYRINKSCLRFIETHPLTEQIWRYQP